jgi:integrase
VPGDTWGFTYQQERQAMKQKIKVKVVEFRDRRHYQMQWRDPASGRKKTKSTGVERTGRKRERTEAERVAAKLESDLRNERYAEPSKVQWHDFRTKYEDEVTAGWKESSDRKAGIVFDLVERIVQPQLLRDLTAERLSYFQSQLRDGTRAESTIDGYVAYLMAGLRWAVDIGLMTAVPKVRKPKRAKTGKMMKGRPISGEEFERMLSAVPKVVGEDHTEDWRRYLNGLWFSGLRLEESTYLYWDDETKLCIDLNGKHPTLRIPGELEKGNQDRLLPLAPEFAELILKTPIDHRTGRVFQLRSRHGNRNLSAERVGQIVVKIGKNAGVVVNRDNDGKVKYASAHDLRRSFGERWAARVMPQVLMELMRHEDIKTTMRFYIGRNAQRTADILWDIHSKNGECGNTSGNTSPETANSPAV